MAYNPLRVRAYQLKLVQHNVQGNKGNVFLTVYRNLQMWIWSEKESTLPREDNLVANSYFIEK